MKFFMQFPESVCHAVDIMQYATLWSVIICPIAIAYSMGQIIKSVCVCQCVSVCVRLRALSRSHFLIDFYENWYRHKKPQKEE